MKGGAYSSCLVTVSLVILLTPVNTKVTNKKGSTGYDNKPEWLPLQKSAAQRNSKPWWGPNRMSDAAQYPELRSGLYQGDIMIPDWDGRNAVRSKKFLWPHGRIPYIISQNYTEEEKEIVFYAMKQIENSTCVRFVEKTKEVEHIQFFKFPNLGCWAVIGRRKNSKDPIPVNLQTPECFAHRGIVTHELLHVVGLLHEQARPDRDDHVTIHWDNIDKAYWSDFNKAKTKDVTTFDLLYDYKSIMHYPKWAFSKNGKSTITAKGNPNLELGQRNGLTEIDSKKVRMMYKCDEPKPSSRG